MEHLLRSGKGHLSIFKQKRLVATAAEEPLPRRSPFPALEPCPLGHPAIQKTHQEPSSCPPPSRACPPTAAHCALHMPRCNAAHPCVRHARDIPGAEVRVEGCRTRKHVLRSGKGHLSISRHGRLVATAAQQHSQAVLPSSTAALFSRPSRHPEKPPGAALMPPPSRACPPTAAH